MLVSDPYAASRGGWSYDSSDGAAIAILQNGLLITVVEVGDGYVLATVGGGDLRLNSCYGPPSISTVRFERLLRHTEANAAWNCGTGVDIIVTGDFSAC